ncbi:unnamed protein product [Owenia fusiformis]|uniref:Uncharacterized protein n=1 Tax=Owenia fusiformis TaxID=6347 RepID=A0A8S4PWG1_OWEFU|nr:unnamed protein product [Owenia fusiformis]
MGVNIIIIIALLMSDNLRVTKVCSKSVNSEYLLIDSKNHTFLISAYIKTCRHEARLLEGSYSERQTLILISKLDAFDPYCCKLKRDAQLRSWTVPVPTTYFKCTDIISINTIENDEV